MKGFHRTKLIPSLAASAMLAVTLAPLPGFLAPANVYAATRTPLPHITIARTATLVGNAVNVQITYKCSPDMSGNTVGAFEVHVNQSPTSGDTVDKNATCNSKQQKANVTVNGAFSPGKANAIALVEDPARNFGSDSRTITIK